MKLTTKKFIAERETKLAYNKASLRLYRVEDEHGEEWSLILAVWESGEKNFYMSDELLENLDFDFLEGEKYGVEKEFWDICDADDPFIEWDGKILVGENGEEIKMGAFDFFELPSDEENAKIEKFWTEVDAEIGGENATETRLKYKNLIDNQILELCYNTNNAVALGRTLANIKRGN